MVLSKHFFVFDQFEENNKLISLECIFYLRNIWREGIMLLVQFFCFFMHFAQIRYRKVFVLREAIGENRGKLLR